MFKLQRHRCIVIVQSSAVESEAEGAHGHVLARGVHVEHLLQPRRLLDLEPRFLPALFTIDAKGNTA